MYFYSPKDKVETSHSWISPTVEQVKVETMAEPEVGVSWTRFYILIIFSIFTMMQCANWNTFGPIASSAKVSIWSLSFSKPNFLDSVLLV